MSWPLQVVSRIALLATLVTLLTTGVTGPARAIQLRWGSGATDLHVTTNDREMLVVAADSSEGSLPPTWRLLWMADTSAVRFVAIDAGLACQADSARVSAIDPPSTPADSAANLLTAHFCSDGSKLAQYAYFLVDLLGGTHGRLKVVALDPTDPDSSRVLESNDVTFNGGIGGDYAPAILRAASTHATSTLEVRAVGANLADAQLVEISLPTRHGVSRFMSDRRPLRVLQRPHKSQPTCLSLSSVSAGLRHRSAPH
jgi:hypothetical protein